MKNVPKDVSYASTSVRAVILRDNLLLVENLPERNISFLPGGTVEGSESLEETLTRELNEELTGLNFEIGPYLGWIGHYWQYLQTTNSCLNHFFFVHEKITNNISAVKAAEIGREFKWISLNDSRMSTLKPPSLLSQILNYQRDKLVGWQHLDRE